MVAIDTSTIARLRAGARLALAGKGFSVTVRVARCRPNLVAAATNIVMIGGVRVGLVRRNGVWRARCEEAVERFLGGYFPVAQAPDHC